MAISAATELKILIKTAGEQGLRKLGHELNNLGVNTAKVGFKFDQFGRALKRQEAAQVKSINNTRTLSNSWKELAASVAIGSREFKIATQEAARLDAQLAKSQGRAKGGMGRMARTAGAVAGAGVFGGPEGAIGAAIGGLMPGGGPISAAVGGAIGAQVGMFRQAIGGVAEYDAALEKQRKALRLVIGDTKGYAKAQKFLAETSEELAIPQDVIVRQFTQLTASVVGAGLSIDDAQNSFKAIAAGIRGTGGSLEDMRAAMVATSQVFSKGKVSAEELRQQLGERLPGAFTLFADSMNKTPAELDKALEQGKVTLEDFITFTTTLTDTYFENAKKLADGPEAAGDRLKTSMSNLKDAVGDILRPIGAAFQNTFGRIVKDITDATKAFNRFMGIGLDNAIVKAEQAVDKARAAYERTESLTGPRGRAAHGRSINALAIAEEKLRLLKEEKAILDDINRETKDLGETSVTVWENMKAGGQAYLDSIKDVTTQMQSFFESAFKKMEDALVDFVMTGKMNFAEFTKSILADLARISIRQAMTGTLGLFGISASPNAKGNIYAQNGIVPFAKGGVVNSPHIFPFRNGIGLMGEAGPEAIMPLRRGPGGRLGVESSGGGNNIVVNVDASGSSVEGNGAEAKQLGDAIASAIQQQLVKERRPGGLLYA